MRLLHYLLLAFIVFALPSFLLVVMGGAIGSASSYLMFIALAAYYFLNNKNKPLIPFLVLGVLYYAISSLTYVDYFNDYLVELVKYMLFVIAGAEVAKNTNNKILIYFLLIGVSSILFHVLLGSEYGRYSGFYINPNGAGFICIIGYSLCYSLDSKKTRLLFQLIFTIAGILTFSRTFIALWLLITIISAIQNKENFINLGFGFLMLVVLLSITAFLDLNTVRLTMIENIVSGNISSPSSGISTGSRFESWAIYYDDILENPIFGNGFKALSGIDEVKQGVHNSYLMILGEAGIFPFLIFVGIYLKLFFKSFKKITTNPEYLYLSIVLLVLFLVFHNYFTNYVLLFVSFWVYINLNKPTDEKII